MSWILLILVAGIVWFDARSRNARNPILWAIASYLLSIIVIPYYLATRPLVAGEIREGGIIWNFSRAFALVWTILIAGALLFGGIDYGSLGAGKFGGITEGLFFFIVGGAWFSVMLVALVVGLIGKNNSIIERGVLAPNKTAMREGNAFDELADRFEAVSETSFLRSFLRVAFILGLMLLGLSAYVMLAKPFSQNVAQSAQDIHASSAPSKASNVPAKTFDLPPGWQYYEETRTGGYNLANKNVPYDGREDWASTGCQGVGFDSTKPSLNSLYWTGAMSWNYLNTQCTPVSPKEVPAEWQVALVNVAVQHGLTNGVPGTHTIEPAAVAKAPDPVLHGTRDSERSLFSWNSGDDKASSSIDSQKQEEQEGQSQINQLTKQIKERDQDSPLI